MTEKPTDKHSARQVHIWEDPDSQIGFLETSLGHKGWRAVVHSSRLEGGVEALQQVEQKLKEKDYITRMIKDDQGNPALFVNHLGAEASFLEAIDEMGLVKGLRYSFGNLGVKFQTIRNKAADLAHYVTENKAKMIGFIYLLGDVVMAATGLDKAPNLKMRALKSGYGLMGAAQSLIFMNYATLADQQLSKELQRKFDKATQGNGLKIDINGDWLKEADTRSKFTNFMEKNAITVGSLTQIAGRLLWATAGKMEVDHGKYGQGISEQDRQAYIKSGWDRIKDSAFSITGWLLIMMKTDKKDKESKATNPVQFIKKYSNQIAGTANAASTFYGLRGDLRKFRQMGENKINLAGNMAYLTGDVVVALTDSSDYDEKSATHPQTLGRVAAKFIESLPVVLGPAHKEQMAEQVAAFLAQRAQEIEQKKDNRPMDESRLQQERNAIYNTVVSELPEQGKGLGELAAKASTAVKALPASQREAAMEALAATLSEHPAILADKSEITAAIRRQNGRMKVEKAADADPKQHFDSALAELTRSLPHTPDAAATAMDIYKGVYERMDQAKGIPAPDKAEKPIVSPVKIQPHSTPYRDQIPDPASSYRSRAQDSREALGITPSF